MSKFISNLSVADFYNTVDVRDGLNSAFRGLLSAWNLAHQDDRFIRSSRLLKEVIGVDDNNFEEIYDLLIDCTRPRVNFPLVLGNGNFGFPPAYPDFSEMKLTKFVKTAIERSNYGDLNIPFAVPVPCALVNGTLGYSLSETKIPTHNLSEVIDAMIALIKNPELETKELLQYIKGPDLFVGGAIENREELYDIYEKGFGSIKIIVTKQNFNWRWLEDVGDYCNWYGLKFRKLYKKEAYRIEVPYYAFVGDGEKTELMSLKNILEKHIEYYRAYKNELSDNELCELLTSFKEYSTIRKTQEIVSF